MLKISECSENCNTCCVFKISAHVENCNACSKLCWILRGMLKTIICVENYVETACWKFQHVLKTVMHVESYVKISRCVENVYVRCVENHIENRVEVWKKHHHTLRHVLKLSGRFRFSPSVLHAQAKWDIYYTWYFGIQVPELQLYQQIISMKFKIELIIGKELLP